MNSGHSYLITAVPQQKMLLFLDILCRSRRTLQGTRRRAHSFERIQKFPDFPIAHTCLSYSTMANYIICILFKLIGSFFHYRKWVCSVPFCKIIIWKLIHQRSSNLDVIETKLISLFQYQCLTTNTMVSISTVQPLLNHEFICT